MKRLIIMTLTGGCQFPAFYVIFSLVTSVLFGPWLCHCVEISVSVVSSHHISRPGDNVTLTCRVQGVADGTTIQWLKSATGLEKQLIASDDQISDEYKLLKRYYVEIFSLPSVTISILNIYDVTTEDSGRIGCVLPGVVPIHDYAMLQILKKPASISFTTNFAGMTLQENDVISARCSIGHVVPVPHVTIRIGHRSLGHPVFTNSTMNTYCQTWVMCSLPVHLDYDVQSFVTNYHVTYKDDRQLMTCSVNLTHSGWPEFSAPTSYTINVRYSPKFNCSKLMYAELSSRRYTIECHLSYNPSPYEQSVSWRHASHSHLNRLKLGESNAEIRFEETKYFPTTAEDRWSHISLVIDEVQTHHFTSYHFEATNQVGTVTHTVHLKQAQSKLPVTSASVRYVNRTKRPPIAFKAEQSSSAHPHRPTSILVTTFMLLTTLGLNQDSLNDCFR